MDHYGEDGESGDRFSWTPQAAEHQIEEYSPYINTQISQSTALPDRKLTASPLALIRKPPTPGALGEKGFDNLPQVGQVNELKKRFSQQHHQNLVISRRPVRKSAHVPITVAQDQEPTLHPKEEGFRQRSNSRPMSWDSSEASGEVPLRERTRGESLPPPERPPTDSLFQRTAQVRQPFRQKVTTTPTPLRLADAPQPTEENIIESIKHGELTPVLLSQLSGDDSPTKLLDEVLEQFEDNSQELVPGEETKMSKLSVKARTQLWELKAHTQTLPRSFKTRTKSQPCSPLKMTSESPATPTGSTTSFTFNNSGTPQMTRR